MIRIAVSILNFNSAESTTACVRSVVSSPCIDGDREVSVFVTDNGSDARDSSHLEELLATLEEVHIRIHPVNLGFAAGHNRNIQWIVSTHRPDFIWLLNSDCQVEPGCLDALVGCAAENPHVGIWGATLLERDGRTIQCAGGCSYNSWLSTYQPHGRGEPVLHRTRLQEVDFSYLAGASLFFPLHTLESGLLPPARIGPGPAEAGTEFLNESFFLYFEELDLARRLKPGLALGWCREALITHAGGESADTGGSRRSAQAEYHSTLSALKFTRLYYPGRLWFMAPARFFAKVLQLLFTGNIRLLGSVTSAYGDFWRCLRTAGD